MTGPPTYLNALTRDPTTALWWGAVALRAILLSFAVGAVTMHSDDYQRPWLAWTVLGTMSVWTLLTSIAYTRGSWRRAWLVVLDVVLASALMLTSPLLLTEQMYAEQAPLITTVWVGAMPVIAGIRFGPAGGVLAGGYLAVGTGFAQMRVDLDVVRDGVLLVASGLVVGLAAEALRRAAVALSEAERAEAARAERERIARSIHDSVLQVLARVRKRGADVGGEAAELGELAGEQEIALRSLIGTSTELGRGRGERGSDDLGARLRMLATSTVRISAPACEVTLPDHVVDELEAAVREALTNTAKHAGSDIGSWVLVEDLGSEVVVSVRDNGQGIETGRLERAEEEGRLGVARSIKGRVHELGGTVTLDTAPGTGTEWELRVPRDRPSRQERAELNRSGKGAQV
ncbi:Signal transduction histidine kinase [Haloechinothrix alba]|uniref:Signal transduction histidine kinase n=1 Tax=Haloechinothrix alba TaxID=664784 RepID=A0A238V1Z2_9PSEU|nr:ATP-binding protein [Haloechinothrix alba]SNR27603.1 Signal transduction histidine kinase [Haloechinothrix alba]